MITSLPMAIAAKNRKMWIRIGSNIPISLPILIYLIPECDTLTQPVMTRDPRSRKSIHPRQHQPKSQSQVTIDFVSYFLWDISTNKYFNPWNRKRRLWKKLRRSSTPQNEFQGRIRGAEEAVSPHGELVQNGIKAVQHYGLLRPGHSRQFHLRRALRPHRRSRSHPIRLHCT